jgi:hypothetical protein
MKKNVVICILSIIIAAFIVIVYIGMPRSITTDKKFTLSSQELQDFEQKALRGDTDASNRVTLHFARGTGERLKAFEHILKIADNTTIDSKPLVLLARYTISDFYANGVNIDKLLIQPDKEKAKYYQEKAIEYMVFHCDESCFIPIKLADDNYNYGNTVFFYRYKPSCEILADEVALRATYPTNFDTNTTNIYLETYKKYCPKDELAGILQ